MDFKRKIYFKNLNGLRFIAALMVIIHHVEQIKFYFGIDNFRHIPFIHMIGKQGVNLFFVLSGFLITFLLLSEESLTKRISIKSFYIRRVLRIWPLYFLIVILGLFVFPLVDFMQIPNYNFYDTSLCYRILLFTLFLFFMPNLVLAMGEAIPFVSQSWSIGTEEQFYLIWPLLVKYFKNRFVLMFYVIVVYLGIKFILILFLKFLPSNSYLQIFNDFWGMFSIDSMAIGGLAACLYFYKKQKILNFLFKKYVQISLYLAIITLLLSGVFINYIHNEVYSLLYAIVILNLAVNEKTILNIENNIFNYLGQISYGLYMYHGIAILISLKLLNTISFQNNLFLYLFSMIITIIFSSISYYFYEKRFLKLKLKYTKIVK